MELKKAGVDNLDIRMAVAIFICVIASYGVKALGYGEYYQTMTAAISVLLCTQDYTRSSWKAGVIRLIVTAIGGICGILVVALDEKIQSPLAFSVLCSIGILLTLFLGKVVKVPYINCRIGGVTFILVVLTRQGSERISYAVFRILSTLWGVLVVIAIAVIWEVVLNRKKNE